MDEIDGSTSKKKILFSIGSYREKKKINKITAAELFTASNSVPPSPTNHIKPGVKERPASLDITDSPFFEGLQHQSFRKFTFQNGNVTSPTSPLSIEKPTCPPTLKLDNNKCPAVVQQNNNGLPDKPARPPQLCSRSMSLEPEQLRHSGKVALTIAAYEGEPKTPTRMEFLPPQPRLSRSSSKSSDISSTPVEDPTTPISSRLQDELVATLKRSNLKKRHDTSENGRINETMDVESISNKMESNGEIANGNGNVRKLATELTKTLTFKMDSEE